MNRFTRIISASLHYTKMALNSEHNKLSSLVVRSFVIHDGQLTIRDYCLAEYSAMSGATCKLELLRMLKFGFTFLEDS